MVKVFVWVINTTYYIGIKFNIWYLVLGQRSLTRQNGTREIIINTTITNLYNFLDSFVIDDR